MARLRDVFPTRRVSVIGDEDHDAGYASCGKGSRVGKFAEPEPTRKAKKSDTSRECHSLTRMHKDEPTVSQMI